MADKQPGQDRSHRGTGCCCCLFGLLWKILVAIIVLVGLAVLIFWLIVKPRAFKFYVSEAKLTQFDYTNNTLHYNLVLNFTARNPNKKLSFYYDEVKGSALYEGLRFSTADVITFRNSFRQYPKSTDRMSGVFSGQQLLLLDSEAVNDLNEDKKAGAFDIDVKLHFTIRFRLGNLISGDYHPKVKCELKVPLSSNNGTTSPAFESTQCDVDF